MHRWHARACLFGFATGGGTDKTHGDHVTGLSFGVAQYCWARSG